MCWPTFHCCTSHVSSKCSVRRCQHGCPTSASTRLRRSSIHVRRVVISASNSDFARACIDGVLHFGHGIQSRPSASLSFSMNVVQ